MPILLFNEADALISKRKNDTSGNCAQTENAIQNIILQEMGGKYENQYAAAMLGNIALCKFAPGTVVAVTLRFTTREYNGQVYQDILVTDIVKLG